MGPEQAEFLEGLYRQYFSALYRYVSTAVRDEQVAQDLLQDVFHTAAQRIDRLMVHANPGGWLMQTAKYKVLMYFRDRNRQLERLISLDIPPEEGGPDLSGLAVEMPEPEEPVDTLLRRALTEEERRLIWRYTVEQTSYLELSEELGISIWACQKRVERIRKKLRAAMEGPK